MPLNEEMLASYGECCVTCANWNLLDGYCRVHKRKCRQEGYCGSWALFPEDEEPQEEVSA